MLLAEQSYKAGTQTFAAVFSNTEMSLRKAKAACPKKAEYTTLRIAIFMKVQGLRKFVNLLKNHNCERSSN